MSRMNKVASNKVDENRVIKLLVYGRIKELRKEIKSHSRVRDGFLREGSLIDAERHASIIKRDTSHVNAYEKIINLIKNMER
jgi:hypothetical protein